jgi:hypothetical protein
MVRQMRMILAATMVAGALAVVPLRAVAHADEAPPPVPTACQPGNATFVFPIFLPVPGGGTVGGQILTQETFTDATSTGTFAVLLNGNTVGGGCLAAVHEKHEVTASFSGSLAAFAPLFPGTSFSGTLAFKGTPHHGKGVVTVTFCLPGGGSCQTVSTEFIAVRGQFLPVTDEED